MLTARGTKEMTDDPALKDMLDYIQHLSQEALQEMRALIWQLRPQGLEDGLASALMSYGKVLGLDLDLEVKGVIDLPNKIEETLWRIGQEALNNCKKHANTKKARLQLSIVNCTVTMSIQDDGTGFHYVQDEKLPTLGLNSMKERTELLSGDFSLSSEIGKGTTIMVTIPTKG
jgi:two-component system, NarL family, sensor kinase